MTEPARYVVVVTAMDGTKSIVGPFTNVFAATAWGNENENEETGWVCDVCPLEPPEEFS